MSRPKNKVKLQHFAVATEESKRIIAAFKSQPKTVTQPSVRQINQASAGVSSMLAAGIKRAIQ